MGKLEGKVAIVTGGSRGQGQATVELFVKEGAKVAIIDVLDEQGQALVQKLGKATFYQHLDVADEPGWEDLTKKVVEKYGRIDVLVNNAGISGVCGLEDGSKAIIQRFLDVNLIGPYLAMKAVFPYMKKNMKGSIINVSSVSGLRGTCGTGVYDASKWGLRGISKSTAMEGGPFGIRVNSIHPGAINTPMLNPEGLPIETFSDIWSGIALSRVGEPIEVANVSLFLASDDASYVNGAEIAVDGGWTCGVYLMEKPSPSKANIQYAIGNIGVEIK
jgi:3alpha(or 20beta)-hydroxysteroid dehydrogenase